MWDSLGEEQKQVYKRKTEAAKKEYLKALTAYKATLVASPPRLELVESPAGGAEWPRSRCVRAGCENAPVASGDWDEEFCSSECLVRHCRDVFLAWLAARSAGSSNVVFVK
ncbi:TOX high mobility group box family member 4 [Lonchura striata]|uniref:TOX high mobility group box family member 4 n=1 Tax=Lonchura striata TaxID=40157 RepID=A0A218U896_9PASE|nr:TOX high mobility group box family member 4 [Lonchura striata domestica]